MAERISGIKGYVGELIVGEWLKRQYGKNNIKAQIRPKNIRAAGGPYLDFCVIEKNTIKKVYEIKAQEYYYPPINSSLNYLWGHKKGIDGRFFKDSEEKGAIFQEDQDSKLIFAEKLKTYLVLMIKPSKGYEKDHGIPKGHILFLGDLLKDLTLSEIKKALLTCFSNDVSDLLARINIGRFQ